MENSILTRLLVQANVGEILVQADRDRLASKAPTSAPGIGKLLMSRLTRLCRTTRPRSLDTLRHAVASR